MEKKERSPIPIYIFLFILTLIILNWSNISWLFNYKEMYGLTYDFFNPYPDSPYLVSASEIRINQTAPGQTIKNTPTANPATVNAPVKIASYPSTDKTNSLEIPALGLQTPLVIGENTDIPTLEKDLDKGVVYYPGSVLPGTNGQIVVLGHSAPPNWPHIKHDWVFSEISKLQPGDQIILYFNNKQYTYKITNTVIIKKGQDVGNVGLNGNNNILTIVSCWPPGKDYQRIAVSAELQN